MQDIDDGRTSSHEKENGVDKGMTAVSLTLRLNVNKYTTLTYYKPRIATPSQPPYQQHAQQKMYVEDFTGTQASQ